MIRAFAPCLALSLFASPLWAQCADGPELFSCSFSQGKKAAHICQDGAEYTYAFGRSARAPELFLRRALDDIDFTPWPGAGRYYWEEVTFFNKSVAYVIGVSVDRLSEEDASAEGQLAVHEGDNRLALLICDAGSVRMNFTPLANAWFDAGFR